MSVLKPVVLLFMGLLFLPNMALAKKSVCAQLPKKLPEVEIIDFKNDIIYDLEQSAKTITNLQRMGGASSSKSKLSEKRFFNYADLLLTGNNMGLTRGEYSYMLSVIPTFERIAGGKYCPRINKVFMKFMYNSTIFIAKEYTKNQCAFNKIMDHEMMHHHINIRNKQKYIGWLRKDLQHVANEIVKNYQPVKQEQMRATFERISSELQGAINDYVYKMHLDTHKENMKIDTPSVYLRMTRQIKKCYNPDSRY